ncbi:MAG: serine protease [Planctomycetota bacterium]
MNYRKYGDFKVCGQSQKLSPKAICFLSISNQQSKIKNFLLLLLAFAVATGAWASEEALKIKAKDLLKKNKEAIVSVKLVATTRYVYGGRESHKNEQKSEIVGTVVDPSGLTVISNTAVNPMDSMDFLFDSGGEKMSVKPETNISDVKIVLADGTEILAEMSLKDKDLDLAFVRPKEKPANPMAYINFAKTAEPDVLEDIITLGRLGRELNRVSSVGLGMVTAVVKKPRTFYVIDAVTGFTSMGCPVFNSKGETLGVSVMRHNPVKGGGNNFFGGTSPVVLPAEDLMEVAKQALVAKIAPSAEESKIEKK